MVGIDESDESFHALRWTLDKLFDGMSTRTAPPEEANQEEAANLLTLLHVQKAFHNYGIPVGAGASGQTHRIQLYIPFTITSFLFLSWRINCSRISIQVSTLAANVSHAVDDMNRLYPSFCFTKSPWQILSYFSLFSFLDTKIWGNGMKSINYIN